ncbi:hypothetical protein O3G_MSEX003025 [Manduca sexta]|nr:hypothetical protein O3G_MSEX003025 [Manduca sexta]KAG6443777.1 hypothetical protein O3G_MSEX003025 [Manduca sexta]KAG6443778.1 hypothetical protein O3G_MSEX003025 [Manduca sexta]
MRENIENKPYNEKVGAWLRYLKELRYYFYREAKRKEKSINDEVGPPWYIELSSCQRDVLNDLKTNIHQDLLEDLPNRIRKSLSDLGVTLKIPRKILMQAMNDSVEDPGIFIWNLYRAVYKKSPSELRGRYDMNSMILMSSLVFIDLEECIQELENLTQMKTPPPPVPQENIKKYYQPKSYEKLCKDHAFMIKRKERNKKEKQTERVCTYKFWEPPNALHIKKYYQPKVRYGEYLQQMYVPFYSSTPSTSKKKGKPSPLGYKFRVRSKESYEKLCKDHAFMIKRKERNKKEKQTERVCTYKFWEPPNALRNSDAKNAAIAIKQRMIRQKAKVKHKSLYKNIQYHVGGVSFSGGTPVYLLNNVALLPTGYMLIHGGIVYYNGENITCIQGFWKYPREVKVQCEETCDCVSKW